MADEQEEFDPFSVGGFAEADEIAQQDYQFYMKALRRPLSKTERQRELVQRAWMVQADRRED
jgi:hypothetical protein